MEQTKQQSESAVGKPDQAGVRDGEGSVEYRVAVIEKRLGQMDKRLGQMDRRLGQIEGNMKHMATKADLEKAVGAVRTDMEKSIGALRNEMQEWRVDMEKTLNNMLRWGIGIMAAMGCAMLAMTGTVVVAMLRLAGA